MYMCIWQNLILRYTYLKMKDLEIPDMNFHCAYPRFRVQWIQRLPHCKEWGEALRHHCWAFHLKVFTSSYKFLHQFVHLWLLTSVLFDNLALTSILVAVWKLLQVLALTIDWKAIASSASSTSFILMKCKCFQPLSWVLLRALTVNCILYLLITFKLSTTFCKCFCFCYCFPSEYVMFMRCGSLKCGA